MISMEMNLGSDHITIPSSRSLVSCSSARWTVGHRLPSQLSPRQSHTHTTLSHTTHPHAHNSLKHTTYPQTTHSHTQLPHPQLPHRPHTRQNWIFEVIHQELSLFICKLDGKHSNLSSIIRIMEGTPKWPS